MKSLTLLRNSAILKKLPLSLYGLLCASGAYNVQVTPCSFELLFIKHRFWKGANCVTQNLTNESP